MNILRLALYASFQHSGFQGGARDSEVRALFTAVRPRPRRAPREAGSGLGGEASAEGDEGRSRALHALGGRRAFGSSYPAFVSSRLRVFCLCCPLNPRPLGEVHDAAVFPRVNGRKNTNAVLGYRYVLIYVFLYLYRFHNLERSRPPPKVLLTRRFRSRWQERRQAYSLSLRT